MWVEICIKREWESPLEDFPILHVLVTPSFAFPMPLCLDDNVQLKVDNIPRRKTDNKQPDQPFTTLSKTAEKKVCQETCLKVVEVKVGSNQNWYFSSGWLLLKLHSGFLYDCESLIVLYSHQNSQFYLNALAILFYAAIDHWWILKIMNKEITRPYSNAFFLYDFVEETICVLDGADLKGDHR